MKQGQTVASTEIDTSNWETFTDQELGFSYRHPADCSLNGAGPGTNATNAIGCGGRSFMFYKPLDYSYAKNSPFVNLTLYGAADAYHQVNLLYRQKHGRETGRLGDIVAGILGKNRTYQFTLDAPLEDPCFSDGSVDCSGSLQGFENEGGTFERENLLTFVELNNGKDKLMFQTPVGDATSTKMLSTLKFN